VEFIVRKVFNTKLFDDVDGDKSWARSIVAIEGDVLFISQFTLHAELKGNKPSYHRAMGPTAARELYERFLTRARSEYKDKVGKIEDGEFGAMMDVHIVNDGPVTIVLDSKNRN
jgi:D-tyrosyl-tRNA(Tyr) deacylase